MNNEENIVSLASERIRIESHKYVTYFDPEKLIYLEKLKFGDRLYLIDSNRDLEVKECLDQGILVTGIFKFTRNKIIRKFKYIDVVVQEAEDYRILIYGTSISSVLEKAYRFITENSEVKLS